MASRKVLKNKPLIEAIFELRWKHKAWRPPERFDPYYNLLIGRFYEKISGDYPFYEGLDTANMPAEIAGHIVQHRFRKGKGDWPAVQIGPGVLTLNDTKNYEWTDFERRANRLVSTLYEVYPEPETLNVEESILRYIDAILLNYDEVDVFAFMEDKMKTGIKLCKDLFNDNGVKNVPLGLDLKFVFPSSNPRGVANIRFYRGKKNEEDALIWDTVVHSIKEDAPNNPKEIKDWLIKAHGLTHDWFFKIIEGDLERRFE